ncbi:hypothetical protein DOTSEDRAFT_155813, partial [Dothistroma septosporum NZE10]
MGSRLLPISDDPHETRELFFWFWPSLNQSCPKEIAIWFNGGPGCSSLLGFIDENGPFMWQDGTAAPTRNSYDWRNLTNVMWVEQPVGVGFTQGKPNVTSEEESSKQFVGFYKNFAELFNVKGFEIFLTGESYAGYYLPYIANEFIDQNHSDYPLTAVHINDPVIGDSTAQQGLTAVPFAQYWSNLLWLNDTTMANMSRRHEECGYKDILEKYLTFPALQEPFPVLKEPEFGDPCDTLDYIYAAASYINPCFNIYRISDICPILSTILDSSSGGFDVDSNKTYFNRTDVQEALHVKVGTAWESCSTDAVFPDARNQSDPDNVDLSAPPAQNGVLQRVIEHTNRVIIGSGNLDALLNTNGTLITIQNMTWNGWQGFDKYPDRDFISPFHLDTSTSTSGIGIVGKWGSERGLTFYQIQLAGHMVPGDALGPSFRVMELLLGRIGDLGEHTPFTTDRG